jgi:hypothetical protein
MEVSLRWSFSYTLLLSCLCKTSRLLQLFICITKFSNNKLDCWVNHICKFNTSNDHFLHNNCIFSFNIPNPHTSFRYHIRPNCFNCKLYKKKNKTCYEVLFMYFETLATIIKFIASLHYLGVPPACFNTLFVWVLMV